MPEWRNW